MMSARTVRDFQGMGINYRLYSKLFADFPSVTDAVFAGDVNESSHGRRNRAQSHYFWVNNASDDPSGATTASADQ